MAARRRKSKTWRELASQELKDLRDKLNGQLETLKQELEDESESEEGKTLFPRPWIYWVVVVLYIIVQLILGVFAWSWTTVVVSTNEFPVNVGVVALLLQLTHLLASLRIVGVDELAGIDFFGRPAKYANPGLHLVPYLLLTLTSARRPYQDVRFPGPADNIYRVSEKLQIDRPGGDIPEGEKVRPIFVTTGEARVIGDENREELLKANPLEQQLNIEIAYFVRYRPHQDYGGIFRITRNLARGSGVDARIKDLVREQSERDIKSVITRQTTATVIANWSLVNEVFALQLQMAILRLGVQVDLQGAGLDDLNPSRDTNVEQANVARARFKRAQTIIAAEAEKEKRILEGAGAAEAERLRLDALARGYKRIADDAEVDGEAVIASETAKVALGQADTIVVGTEGIKELFGLVRAGKGVLGRGTPSSTPDNGES